MRARATSVTQSPDSPTDTITLDQTARHRRRMKMTSDHGVEFLLDLREARLLRDGEGIELDDGRVIEVIAKPEPLYEVRGCDATHLLSLAWQLGNRHLPTQILESSLRIRRDHVIREMLEGLGGLVREVEAPFDPEGGAYGGHQHQHD